MSAATEEHAVLQAARQKAEAARNTGRTVSASQAFMDVLDQQNFVENERREEHRRLSVQLLEEALFYDKVANNTDAAFEKLRLVAEQLYPGDSKGQGDYLIRRASQFDEQGTLTGDNAALLIAIKILSWLLAKGKIDG